MEQAQLKPCCCCGNHKLNFVINAITHQWCVICEECGQESNWHNTREDAIKEWNKLQ